MTGHISLQKDEIHCLFLVCIRDQAKLSFLEKWNQKQLHDVAIIHIMSHVGLVEGFMAPDEDKSELPFPLLLCVVIILYRCQTTWLLQNAALRQIQSVCVSASVLPDSCERNKEPGL